MPDQDPCAGLTGAELHHCLLLQYANGCEISKAAVASAKKAGLINAAQAGSDAHYIDHGEQTFKSQIGDGA